MFERRVSFWELDDDLAIGPQLHRILRERIVSCDLLPGSKLSESEVARMYSISRQPVREALIKLSEEGLVSIRPQRGSIVRKINYSAVLDARFVREAIEADIVRLVTEQSDRAAVKELRSQLERQRRVAKDALMDFMKLDELFHRSLAEFADKASAWQFVEGLKSQMDRVRFLSLTQFPMKKLINQHKAIVDGIAEGNVDHAEQSTRLHLREILTDLPKIQAANPAFFDEASSRRQQNDQNKLEVV